MYARGFLDGLLMRCLSILERMFFTLIPKDPNETVPTSMSMI